MKKLKLSLAAFALLFAVGTAIASHTDPQGYLWNEQNSTYEPADVDDVISACPGEELRCGMITEDGQQDIFLEKDN